MIVWNPKDGAPRLISAPEAQPTTEVTTEVATEEAPVPQPVRLGGDAQG